MSTRQREPLERPASRALKYVTNRMRPSGRGPTKPAPTIVTLVVLALLPLVMTGTQGRVVVTTAIIYAVGAVGLDLLFGYEGQLSFGQFVYFAFGAYGMTVLMTQWNLPLLAAAAIAVVGAGVIAGIVSGVLSRIGVLGGAIGSFFLASVVVDVLSGNQLASYTGGEDGLSVPSATIGGLDLTDGITLYYVSLVALAISAAVVLRYVAVRSGTAAAVIKRNEIVAGVLGINVMRERIKVAMVAAMLAAVGGCLLAVSIGFLSPETFGTDQSVTLFAIVAVGGARSVVGPIIGAVFYFGLTDVLSVSLKSGAALAFSIALIVVVVFADTGIYGGIELLLDRARRLWRRRAEPGLAGGAKAPVDLPAPDEDNPAVPSVLGGRTLTAATQSSASPLLTVANLSVHYGGVRALDGVDLSVRAGEIHAVIGPNGAGKTTLLNCISGCQRQSGGSIVLGDQEITSLSMARRRRLGLGRTFQHPSLVLELDAFENVKAGGFDGYGRSLISEFAGIGPAGTDARSARTRAERALSLVGFPDARWGVAGNNLTMGDQKRVDIARGVAANPSLLLVDEPTAGLGPEEISGVVEVMNAVRAAGIGVLVIAHHVGFVRLIADTCTVLNFGQVIARGTPEDVMRDETVMGVFMGAEDEQ